MSLEEKLAELGLTLPPLHKPAGTYVPGVIVGDLLFLSGQGPRLPDGSWGTGKVGENLTVEQAYDHARCCGLMLLSAAKHVLGDLSKVRRVVKVLGMVNASPEFGEQPSVINGCSDLLVQVFGGDGQHARSAVGMGSLPRGISVEVEAIFQIHR